jgi:hypothetical protein
MTCCGKTKKIINKGKNIAIGFTNLARGVKYEWTDGRIEVCRGCDKNYWIGRTLWCSICKCCIPAKARVAEEKCPLNKWKE